eukprot:GSChrysophyteH1.ASY1.ANO1.761.1 assembled CDS
MVENKNVGASSDDPYEPKNIMITGGAGFIASHVVILLAKKYPQYNIINYDRLDYCSCIENLEEVENLPNYKFIKGNICSSELVNYVLETENIDTIMHFAAQTHVDNSFGNSFQFTQNNIMGTHVLLESAKIAKIKRFIHVSTDEVYGEQQKDQAAMDEEQILEPTNPYAATKAGAEFLAKSYLRSFDFPLIITRGNNVYGPHQYPEKLIPKFINQLKRGRKVTLHGTGANMRNFLYVEDDLIKLSGYSGKEEEMMTFVEDRFFNDLRYHINSDRLFELGWEEQVSWEDGIRLTHDWYIKNAHRYGDIESALVAHPRAGLDKGAY